MAMRFVRLGLSGLLAVATVTVVFAQGNRPTQPPDEFRRMLAMGTKYRTAPELYAALKMAAPGGGRQMPAFAPLPDWSGLWTASGGGRCRAKTDDGSPGGAEARHRQSGEGDRIRREPESMWTARISALAGHPVPPRVHREAGRNMADFGNGEQRPAYLYRRAGSSAGRRAVSAVLR